VPERYRALVGKAEVWRPLDTTDRRTANTRCAAMAADLEREWARLSAVRDGIQRAKLNALS
jgi:hypothetical protein